MRLSTQAPPVYPTNLIKPKKYVNRKKRHIFIVIKTFSYYLSRISFERLIKTNLVKINSEAKQQLENSRRAQEEQKTGDGAFAIRNLDDWRKIMTRDEPLQNQNLKDDSIDFFNKKVISSVRIYSINPKENY